MPSPDPTPGGPSARLWAASRPAALATLHGHPFVRRLADGSLEEGVWARFVGQDAAFLGGFRRAYGAAAAAAAAAGDVDAEATCLRLQQAVDDELKLHARAGCGDGATVATLPATDSYCSFLESASQSHNVATILAAMAPCSRLYGFLGVELQRAGCCATATADGRVWIETYAGTAYHEAVVTKEALLDRLVGDDCGLEGECEGKER